MCVMPDQMIRELSQNPETQMIAPFSERVDGDGVASYGLEPAGYTARLHPVIKVIDWARAGGKILNPLKPDESFYFEVKADPSFSLPPHSAATAWTLERFRIPREWNGLGFTKTSYANAGLNLSIADIAPGWEGHLKLHISNTSSVPLTVFGNMGIVLVKFLKMDGKVGRDYSQLKNPRFHGHGPQPKPTA